MKKITVRNLVTETLGPTGRLTQSQVERAVYHQMAEGWLTPWKPTVADADRHVALVRMSDDIAPLYFLMLEEPDFVPVQRLLGLLSRKQRERIDSLSTLEARNLLSRHGLILASRGPEGVSLEAHSPDFARVINNTRYGTGRRGFLVRSLIADVSGMAQPPKRITEQMRMNAALLLESYQVDASDVLDERKDYARLWSQWNIDTPPAQLVA